MNSLIKKVDSEHLSEVLEKAHVELTPRESKMLNVCRNMSLTTWIGYNNDELICIWGVIPPSIISEEVYLWLHTTGAIKTSQFIFVRHSQMVIQELLKEYKLITGHVSVNAPASKRWLKWLGAEFGHPKAGMFPFRIERHG